MTEGLEVSKGDHKEHQRHLRGPIPKKETAQRSRICSLLIPVGMFCKLAGNFETKWVVIAISLISIQVSFFWVATGSTLRGSPAVPTSLLFHEA